MEVIHTDEEGQPQVMIMLDEQLEKQIIQLLVKYGFHQSDFDSMRHDLTFLRHWRLQVEQCRSAFWRALIHAITLGFISLLSLGMIHYFNSKGN